MTVHCTPTDRVTITPGLLETYPIRWAVGDDAEPGQRLVDTLALDELDLTVDGDEALVPLVTEIVTGIDVVDPHNALRLTVTATGDITATVDLDELDRIARASGNLHAIAAMDLVRSLRGRDPVDLAVVARWLDHRLVYALAETLTLIADDH